MISLRTKGKYLFPLLTTTTPAPEHKSTSGVSKTVDNNPAPVLTKNIYNRWSRWTPTRATPADIAALHTGRAGATLHSLSPCAVFVLACKPPRRPPPTANAAATPPTPRGKRWQTEVDAGLSVPPLIRYARLSQTPSPVTQTLPPRAR